MMQKLKKLYLTLPLLGTAFVAFGYYCKYCNMDHAKATECPRSAIVKTIYEIVKDKLSHCKSVNDAGSIISSIGNILAIKKKEMLYKDILDSFSTTEQLEVALNVINDMILIASHYACDHGYYDWEQVPFDWDKVFGSDCDSASTLPNSEANQKKDLEEHDVFESGYGDK